MPAGRLRLALAAETPPPATDSQQAAAQDHFQRQVSEVRSQTQAILTRRRLARHQALQARARLLLVKAALVEITLGQQPSLFDETVYPVAFNEQAVRGLQRHGYPWVPLLKLAFEPRLAPGEDDPFFQKIAGEKRESLKQRFVRLRAEAGTRLRELSEVKKARTDLVR